MAELFAHPVVAPLRARYFEPWRHYHDWSHPLAMIGHLAAAEANGVPIIDPVAAAGFVLWHDAIYDPKAPHGRNECLSAELCGWEMVAVADPASVDYAETAILSTIDHRVPDVKECPDGALLLDVDLAILGASEVDFKRYNTQIAAEYKYVPAEAFRSGRATVLRRFLDRERLFVTDWGVVQWEAQARANLAQAITELSEQD
ncbi:HD domain-containing protein [Sphingomonas radiodurans]|uniref:HD domain-containing protein n=1 Tax=Sphingomonas radiodurans TaxID=2890321 RepID=UPI001E5DD826|nr:hypothetical protein [Sphingomonas radiodurans]WBH16864.1 hypothetical protein LLW23_01710 [Sphingomonas radiodurans]